jgi:hypothetical protein
MAGALAVCYETPTRFARYTVADGTGIPKYTLLKLSTPNTAAATAADNDVCGGIAMFEKVASDGSTEITAALNGVWGLKCSAAGITVGNEVGMNGANEIKVYTTLDNEKGLVLGRSLETTAGGDVIKVRLNIL